MKRQGISKKTRFEVFKRDSFKCQYCGRSAPEVILQIDHIVPVASGGQSNIANLITSCFDCNAGKSDRRLDDSSAVQKQKRQNDMLQERREQIKLMAEWQRGLMKIDDEAVEELAKLCNEVIAPFRVSDSYKMLLKRLMDKYGFEAVVTAVRVAANQYLPGTELQEGDKGQVAFALDKVSGICAFNSKSAKDPAYEHVRHAFNILRKYGIDMPIWKIDQPIRDALNRDVAVGDILGLAYSCESPDQFLIELEALTE